VHPPPPPPPTGAAAETVVVAAAVVVADEIAVVAAVDAAADATRVRKRQMHFNNLQKIVCYFGLSHVCIHVCKYMHLYIEGILELIELS